jgi:hypothetical protein
VNSLLLIWQASLLLGLLAALWIVRQAARELQETTLTTATLWSGVALGSWICAATLDWFGPTLPAGLLDQCWYWTAVLSVCPPIAVLGARRPTDRVWTAFILLPLVAVLGWPAATLWAGWPQWRPIEVAAPAVIGFGLVLVMGCGNFIGTRLTLSALLLPLAVTGLLLPLMTFRPDWGWLEISREVATTVLLLAIGSGYRATRSSMPADHPCNRVWNDFRETFGLVWSVRILERLQEQGRRDGWAADWDAAGMTLHDGPPEQRELTEQHIAYTLRWLLRRFVNARWLDARGLPQGSPKIGERTIAPIDS